MIASTTLRTASQLPAVPQTNIKTKDIMASFNYSGVFDLKLFDGKHPSLPASGQVIKMSMFKSLSAVAPSLQLVDAAGANMAFAASTSTFSGTVGGATATSMTYALGGLLANGAYQGACSFSLAAPAPASAGVSVDASTGTLSLAPTAATSSTFAVRVVNQFNVYADFTFSLSMVPAVTYAAPVVVPPSAVPVTANLTATSTAYVFSQTATNAGAIAWSVSGGPPGTAMDASSSDTQGVLSLPAVAGTYTITVQAKNPANATASSTLTVTVTTYATPSVSSPSYSANFTSTSTAYYVDQTSSNAGTITWDIKSGAPAGCSIASSTNSRCYLSLPATSGTFIIVVRATNPAGASATGTMSITVTTYGNPSVSSPSYGLVTIPPNTTNSTSYYVDQSTTNTGTVTWNIVSGAPAGATIASSTNSPCYLSLPATSGTFSIAVSATNAAGASATGTMSVSVTPYGNPSVSSPSYGLVYLPSASTSYYVDQSSTDAGTITWNIVSGAPAGATISSSSDSRCYLSLPATRGSFNIVVRATNPAGASATGTMSISLTTYAPPSVTSPSYGTAYLSSASTSYYVDQVAANAGTISWSIMNGAPSGTTISSSTDSRCYLSLPATSGTYNIVIFAYNPDSLSAGGTMSITIVTPPVPTGTGGTIAVPGPTYWVGVYDVSTLFTGGSSYSISGNDSGGIIIPTLQGGTGFLAQSTVWATNATTSYNVTIEASNGAGNATTNMVVAVGMQPVYATQTLPYSIPNMANVHGSISLAQDNQATLNLSDYFGGHIEYYTIIFSYTPLYKLDPGAATISLAFPSGVTSYSLAVSAYGQVGPPSPALQQILLFDVIVS